MVPPGVFRLNRYSLEPPECASVLTGSMSERAAAVSAVFTGAYGAEGRCHALPRSVQPVLPEDGGHTGRLALEPDTHRGGTFGYGGPQEIVAQRETWVVDCQWIGKGVCFWR